MASRSRLALAVSALSIGGLLALSIPATAATDPILKRLLPAGTAKTLGFPTVYQKPISSHKTNQKNCTDAAEVAFVNNKTSVGLIDEVFSCKTAKDANSYVASYRKQFTPDTSMKPPKELGKGAVGSSADAPLFAYYWTRGSYVAFVGLDTDATNASAQASAGKNNPLTAKLGATLRSAAEHQDALLR